MAEGRPLQLREFGDMSSKNADNHPGLEQAQQEHSVHGEATQQQGHSGEGAASAFAHMLQQDQKNRRRKGESEEDATLG
jgi:hypothetical protein